MSGVDDLFSSEAPARVPDGTRRVTTILGVAFVLNALGITCFTGVPGAILTLVGWHLADEEVSKIDNGVVPKERMPRARGLRRFAYGQMVFASVCLLVQLLLFAEGFYEQLLVFVFGLFGAVVPQVVP